MAEFNLCIGMLAILCGLASMGERTAPLDCQIQTNGICSGLIQQDTFLREY